MPPDRRLAAGPAPGRLIGAILSIWEALLVTADRGQQVTTKSTCKIEQISLGASEFDRLHQVTADYR